MSTSAAHWSFKTVFIMLAPPPVRSVQLLNHLCTHERLLSNSGTLVRLRCEKEPSKPTKMYLAQTKDSQLMDFTGVNTPLNPE